MKFHLLDSNGVRVFGPGPYELLLRVEATGSLHAASADMGMAYSKAMRLLHAAEEAFGERLTRRQVGGAGGGGSELTPFAKELLHRYSCALEDEKRHAELSFTSRFAGIAGVARLGCVVMASGAARRFGANKLLKQLSDKPVLYHTLDALSHKHFELVVVTRSEAVKALCEAHPRSEHIRCLVHDKPHLSDTIRKGLSVLEHTQACLFVPGDQALLTRASVEKMLHAYWRDTQKIIRLSWQTIGKSPVLFPADCYQALTELSEDEGGAKLLAPGAQFASRVELISAQFEEELFDIDTPADLAHLETVLKRRIQQALG